MVVTILNKDAGFFSQFFFMVNHFIYARSNNITHKIDGSQWLFNCSLGWGDYFENIPEINVSKINDIKCSHIDWNITECPAFGDEWM